MRVNYWTCKIVTSFSQFCTDLLLTAHAQVHFSEGFMRDS
jgi:hypothetical protein